MPNPPEKTPEREHLKSINNTLAALRLEKAGESLLAPLYHNEARIHRENSEQLSFSRTYHLYLASLEEAPL